VETVDYALASGDTCTAAQWCAQAWRSLLKNVQRFADSLVGKTGRVWSEIRSERFAHFVLDKRGLEARRDDYQSELERNNAAPGRVIGNPQCRKSLAQPDFPCPRLSRIGRACP
jgi:hypothetical protein